MKPKYYLKKLKKFPHRGVGTKNEKEAAKLISSEYKKLGFNPKTHRFKTISNSWIVEFLRHIVFVPSLLFILLGNFWLGLAFWILGIFLNITQSTFTARTLSKVFSTTSQNVFARLKPKNKVKRTFVILGHIDTARRTLGLDFIAGFIGKNAKITKDIDKKFPNFFRGPFFLTNIAIVLNLIALISINISLLKFSFAIISFLIFFPTSLLMLHTMLSPFVPGAFDNGTGTCGVLTIAEYFSRRKPLTSTEIIFLNNGSEESLIHGFDQFLKEANINLDTTYFINLEGIGADQPLLAYGETDPLGKSCFYEKHLYSYVHKFTKTNTKYKSFEKYYLAVPTDCYDLHKRGCQIMVTLSSLENDDYYSHYHKMTDTIDKIDFNTMKLCYNLCVDLIEAIDKKDIKFNTV